MKTIKLFLFLMAISFGGYFLIQQVGFLGVFQKVPETPFKLRKVSPNDLPGLDQMIVKIAVASFQKSCEKILKAPPEKPMDAQGVYGTHAPWQKACRSFGGVSPATGADFLAYLKEHFHVYQVLSTEGEILKERGLFTGYYEPELKGSLKKTKRYSYPLYHKPKNLVITEDLGTFKKELEGIRLKGHVDKGVFKPFLTRKKIDGLDKHKHFKPLAWVDSDIDAFFLHIQGSGLVRLPDGSLMRVGYAEQNGHRYVSIGKLLLERGHGTRETMGMDFIKAWLKENPDEGKKLMHENPSYIFFRKLNTEGPLGSMGVPLTPEASLAVDRGHHGMGVPMWLSVDHPLEVDQKLHRFVVAQDTGGAIKGALRGDLFWGAGKKAARHAGEMKSRGYLYAFIPKEVVLKSEYLDGASGE